MCQASEVKDIRLKFVMHGNMIFHASVDGTPTIRASEHQLFGEYMRLYQRIVKTE